MFDVNKNYRTRDGRKARYLGQLAGNSDVGTIFAVEKVKGNESVVHYNQDGRQYNDAHQTHGLDIFEAPATMRRKLALRKMPNVVDGMGLLTNYDYADNAGQTVEFEYDSDTHKIVGVRLVEGNDDANS